MKVQIKCLIFSVVDRLNERSLKRFKTWIAASLLTFLAVAPTAWSAGAPSAPQIKQASVNGVTLAYQEQGDGAPVVFIHGCCTDSLC